jgi:hypothetical protein
MVDAGQECGNSEMKVTFIWAGRAIYGEADSTLVT